MTLATLLTLAVMGVAPGTLEQAARALDDLQYETALAVLPPEAEVGGYSRAELVTWFSTRALALLGLKKDAEAAETFRRLFTFAPEWKLPEQYGPKVVTLVAGLRAEAEERGAPSLTLEGGVLKATGDSTGLAQELEVSWRPPGGPATSTRLPLVPAQPPPWPQGAQLEVWGRVLGLSGSTLAEWASEQAPLRVGPLAPTPAAVTSKPLGRWAFLGLGAAAAGLVAGGLGVGLAVSSQEAERALASATRDGSGRITSLSQRDAFALDARAQGNATGAGALFLTGGLLVAAGAGLFIFDRVTVAPAPGGALLTAPLDAHFAVAGAEVGR